MTRGADDRQPPSLDSTVLWDAIECASNEAGLGVYVATLQTQPAQLLYVNATAAKLFGRPVSELVGHLPWDVLVEADLAKVQAVLGRPPGAPPTVLDVTVRHTDGHELPVTLAAARISSAIGELSFGFLRDVSHERATLEALQRSEARFRFLVEAAPDGVVILQRGTIVFMNPKAARLLGVETVDAALGRPIASFLPPGDAALAGQRIMAMLREGIEFPPSEYGVLADPTRVVEIKSIVCDWNGEPGVLAFARDVTERKTIQKRLVESDRLAALGTLAAGVAHEINNPLTYAQLSAQRITRMLGQLEMSEEARTTLRSHLDDIQHGIKRVASITHTLHSFVSHDDTASGPVDLEDVVTRALKMVDNDLRHAARLVRDLAPVPPVTGNAARLEQVIVNVLINAIKALPANASTRHEIGVSLAHTGDRVTVTIRDTGCGIPAALRGRIFDPFFTTRDVGHGMGLGLSVSKTIVEKFGGAIEVDSIENAGTTVRVLLRVYASGGSARPASQPSEADMPNTRRLRVLVVDDEEIICTVLRRMLAEHHDVATVRTGHDALRELESAAFDMILCDVMMPGMNGDELHRRVAASHPELARRFVFMSGGALHPELDHALNELPNHRLAKPFRVEQLLQLVASFA